MKIIDKAAWQIDGGIPEEFVVKHFQFVFLWLYNHEMLSDEGVEEFEDGVDSCASLNEDLITLDALIFLDTCYDEYLKLIEANGIYGSELSVLELEKVYLAYKQNSEK